MRNYRLRQLYIILLIWSKLSDQDAQEGCILDISMHTNQNLCNPTLQRRLMIQSVCRDNELKFGHSLMNDQLQHSYIE